MSGLCSDGVWRELKTQASIPDTTEEMIFGERGDEMSVWTEISTNCKLFFYSTCVSHQLHSDPLLFVIFQTSM